MVREPSRRGRLALRMVYGYIFLAALATGLLVFWLTLRSSPEEPVSGGEVDGDGFLPPKPGTVAAPATDGMYVPIVADRRSWQTRVAGFLGLVILVSLAAAGLAFGLYQAGSWVARLLSDYAS
jgi:hypothetical protein